MAKANKEGQRKAPILRFKGFTDDWEQRKLREISSSTIGGGTPKSSNKKFWNGNIPWIQSSDLVNGDIWNITIKKHITLNAVENSAAKIISANSIAVVTRVAVGKLVYMPLEYATSQDFISFQNLSGDHSFFMYLVSKVMHKVRGSLQGTSIKGISKGELLKKKVIYTLNIKEQKKIGTLLKSLDTILTLYERKIKLLSQEKKYFLDNLFAGKEYPNLRFKGFTDAWEQRKLLKVCKKEDNKRIPIKEQERKEGNTPYFGANGIQGYIDGYTHDGTNILIAEDGANNVRNYPIKLITGKIWVNNHAHVLKVNTKTNNGNFLVGAIKKINFYRYLVGSSRYKLTAESLNQVKIKIAKQSEQEKIGELLKNIEELLTLYENKQQYLTEIKNVLLNTMFI